MADASQAALDAGRTIARRCTELAALGPAGRPVLRRRAGHGRRPDAADARGSRCWRICATSSWRSPMCPSSRDIAGSRRPTAEARRYGSAGLARSTNRPCSHPMTSISRMSRSQAASTSQEAHRAGRASASAKKYVYFFGNGKADGNRHMKDLLGGKGSGLAEMTNAGLPVPPGLHDLHRGLHHLLQGEGARFPPAIDREIDEHLKKLEKAAGATLGSTDNPLLVSVRSGAKFSMPGMMDTILNLGLNDDAVEGLKRADAERPVRVRQLPPLHPDVRQRRARDSEGRVRARVRGREEGARREARHRSRRRRAARGGRALQAGRAEARGPRVSAGTRTSSSRWRATPCSARG